MELCSYKADVVEQCRIYPPPASLLLPASASLPLTFFDLLWLSNPPVQRLFFYEFHGSKTHFLTTIIPNMKHSLSLALQHFFPLLGNLTWPHTCTKPQILYTQGDSVSFRVAISDQDFCHLSGNHYRHVNAFFSLLPELTRNECNPTDAKAYPVLALQVTLFPDKGICIGLTYHHSAADGRSLIHFIKYWASICCQLGDAESILTSHPTEKSPVFCDRNLVKDPNGIDMILLNKRFKKANITQDSFNLNGTAVPDQDMVAATFVIRPSDVKRLKQWVLTRGLDDPPSYISTFVLTCAYVWVCLIKAQLGEAADDEDRFKYLIFPIDCRARQKPPLPTTYFGNCLVGGVVKANTSDLVGKDGIAIAAKLIGNKIQENEDGSGILRNMETYSSKDFLAAKGPVMTVAGSTKLGIYGTNFGWGKLKKVEVASIYSSGAMSLCECPDEIGAVEVGLVRNKIEMDAFKSLSAEILAALQE